MINGLDLFSGIGGISLALQDWVRPIAYCEIDRYARAALLSRMQDGLLSQAPIWDDVSTLRRKNIQCKVDIIYGGFPCQDISVAGNGEGLEGERSGLFFEIIRLARELRPKFIFLENVPAITIRGLDRVLLEITSLGFDCRWTTVSAQEVGACHIRNRWFLLAYANGSDIWKQSGGISGTPWAKEERITGNQSKEGALAYTSCERLERIRREKPPLAKPCGYGRQYSEPSLRRGDYGLLNRVDRIKGLGNAVVPMQAREAFIRLLGELQ